MACRNCQNNNNNNNNQTCPCQTQGNNSSCGCTNCNARNSCSQKEMLNQIMALNFAINDLALYLDTHPEDQNAIRMHTNMYYYVKSLQYPINIKCRNPKLAKVIISQYGGPDGELGASLRYLSQRFGMPDKKSKAILNDVGTEELAHLEMVGTLVHQLTDGASPEEMEAAGLGAYYTDHGWGVYPQAAAGFPWTAATIAVKGDPVADLTEDLAAD